MTYTLEENMEQNLAIMCPEPIFHVLLDVQKLYNLLYRTRCMEVLLGYSLSPKLRRLI